MLLAHLTSNIQNLVFQNERDIGEQQHYITVKTLTLQFNFCPTINLIH